VVKTWGQVCGGIKEKRGGKPINTEVESASKKGSVMKGKGGREKKEVEKKNIGRKGLNHGFVE